MEQNVTQFAQNEGSSILTFSSSVYNNCFLPMVNNVKANHFLLKSGMSVNNCNKII